jgi:hypothetical protein
VVNVTDGTDVNVRLSPLELCLCHRFLLERFSNGLPSTALIAAETPVSLLGGFGFGEIADSGTNVGTWSLFAQGPDCGLGYSPAPALNAFPERANILVYPSVITRRGSSG